MTVTACPLCGSLNSRSIDFLPFAFLSKLYKQFFGINLEEGRLETIELRACEYCDLKFYNPSLTGDERFYEQLQKFEWYYMAEKEEYDVARRHITDESSVLEIGVGYGAFAKKIKARSYVGLELNDSAVSVARQRGLPVYKSTVETHAIGHMDEYDVVCSFQVLEHVADPKQFIESSLKCLKRGGKLIQSVPSEDSFLGQEVNNILNMPPHHVSRWTDKTLNKFTELFDLEIIEICHDRLSDFHVRPYCIAQIRTFLNKICKYEQRSLDPKFATLFARVAVRGLSLLPEMRFRYGRLRPMGHSVTATYRKL
jgi:2-polyprenyl-3-methyl-5-hydroxy-6-metoxy-1,4-benzoquinol methylase